MIDSRVAAVMFADRVDAERGHHTRVCPTFVQRVLHREGVHHGSQHPDMITCDAVEPTACKAGAAEYIAAADDQPNLDATFHQVCDLPGDTFRLKPFL